MSTIFDFEADCLFNSPHLSCFLCMFLRSERKRVCSNKISRLGGMTKQEFGFLSGFTFDGHLCSYKDEHMQYAGPDNFKFTPNIYDCMTRDYSKMRTVSTMCYLWDISYLVLQIFQIMPSCFASSGTADPLLTITQGVADSTLTIRQTQSACASVKHAKLGIHFIVHALPTHAQYSQKSRAWVGGGWQACRITLR